MLLIKEGTNNQDQGETDVVQLNKNQEKARRLAKESIPPEVSKNCNEDGSGEIGGAEGVAKELRREIETRLEALVGDASTEVRGSKRGRTIQAPNRDPTCVVDTSSGLSTSPAPAERGAVSTIPRARGRGKGKGKAS